MLNRKGGIRNAFGSLAEGVDRNVFSKPHLTQIEYPVSHAEQSRQDCRFCCGGCNVHLKTIHEPLRIRAFGRVVLTLSSTYRYSSPTQSNLHHECAVALTPSRLVCRCFASPNSENSAAAERHSIKFGRQTITWMLC